VLELHRRHGVHPLHGLRSLLGLAVQVPVFLAAYHVLEGSTALAGASFLWITDLAQPDRVARLPIALPLLGDSLHGLPFLMTAITLLASRLHDDGALPPALLRAERRNLYWMAAAFFLLFYRFPAGMVLYWTTSNACRRPGRARRASPEIRIL
jgi:YidC/Oxa1 family membrane protein insertase